MASIIAIGNKWRAQVRRKGRANKTQTFASREAAEQWAAALEEALEKAAGDAAIRRYQQPAWRDLHTGSGPVDGMPPEVAALPRIRAERCCGIYFLFDKRECVYVGQSVNVLGRALEHFPSKMFDSFAFMEVPARDLDRVEKEYIQSIKPRLNVMHMRKRIGRELATTGLQPA